MKLIENLMKLDEEMQLSLLRDYLDDAKSEGRWHDVHKIEIRLAELEQNKKAVKTLEAEKSANVKKETARRDEQYKNSFVARGID